MATKVLSLVNSRLKSLYQKQKFLTLPLRRLLCNALIQPHYGYAWSCLAPIFEQKTVEEDPNIYDCRRRSKHLKINVSGIVWT